MYYLNVMAGPLRKWRFVPAPEVEWIMKRDAVVGGAPSASGRARSRSRGQVASSTMLSGVCGGAAHPGEAAGADHLG